MGVTTKHSTMKNILINVICILICISTTMQAQTFFQREITNNELEDFGHFSIVNFDVNQDGYILGGTQYDAQGGSFIEMMHILDLTGNKISGTQGGWSIKTVNEHYKDLKCFRMNKKGKDGNYLAIGSATRITDSEKVGLLIEMDATSMQPIKWTVIDAAPLSEDGYMNTLALDAEYIAENPNEGIQQAGYVICGMIFQPTSTGAHQVYKDSPKRSFFTKIDDAMNSVVYFNTFNNDFIDTIDTDYIHRLKYIEGIGIVLGGSKYIPNKSTVHLMIVDPATGGILWQLDKDIDSGSLKQSFGSIADFLYDSQNDALHVAYNNFDDYHSGGYFSIENFSLPIRSQTTPASYVPMIIGAPHPLHSDNQYIKMLLPHPENDDLNSNTPFRFIAQMDFNVGLNFCTHSYPGGGTIDKENVYTAYAEHTYNNTTKEVEYTDFMFKNASTAHWNQAYSDVLNSTINDFAPWGYSNSFCLAADAFTIDSRAVFVHYTTINDRIDLNVFKRSTPATASDACYVKRTFERYPENWVTVGTYNPITYTINLENPLLFIPTSDQRNFPEGNPCNTYLTNCYTPPISGPQFHFLRKKFSEESVENLTPGLSMFNTKEALVLQNIIQSADLIIYDLGGRVLLRKDGLNNGQILLHYLDNGIYIAQLTEGDQTEILKFQKW